MKGKAARVLDLLKNVVVSSTKVVMVMAAVAALVSSPYVLHYIMKPNVRITAGAVASLVPTRLQAELMMVRMPLMAKTMGVQVRRYMRENLEELRMPRSKIDLVIQAMEEHAAGKDAEAQVTERKAKLSPQEDRWIETILAKAAVSFVGDPYLRKQFAFPNSVAFFELKNTGRTDAADVHMIMKLQGSFFSDKIIEEQNRIVSKKAEGDTYEIDIKALSPGARIKGMVWYDKPDTSTESGSMNSITVTYKDGMKEVSFSENAFFTKE